jgi:hypothetical protein
MPYFYYRSLRHNFSLRKNFFLASGEMFEVWRADNIVMRTIADRDTIIDANMLAPASDHIVIRVIHQNRMGISVRSKMQQSERAQLVDIKHNKMWMSNVPERCFQPPRKTQIQLTFF